MTSQRNIAVSRHKAHGFGLCSSSPCVFLSFSLSISLSRSCISKDTDGATRRGSLTACVYRQLYLARAIASLAERQTVRRSERAEPSWAGVVRQSTSINSSSSSNGSQPVTLQPRSHGVYPASSHTTRYPVPFVRPYGRPRHSTGASLPVPRSMNLSCSSCRCRGEAFAVNRWKFGISRYYCRLREAAPR